MHTLVTHLPLLTSAVTATVRFRSVRRLDNLLAAFSKTATAFFRAVLLECKRNKSSIAELCLSLSRASLLSQCQFSSRISGSQGGLCKDAALVWLSDLSQTAPRFAGAAGMVQPLRRYTVTESLVPRSAMFLAALHCWSSTDKNPHLSPYANVFVLRAASTTRRLCIG